MAINRERARQAGYSDEEINAFEAEENTKAPPIVVLPFTFNEPATAPLVIFTLVAEIVVACNGATNGAPP